jgi:hypothetical protein
VTLYRRRRRWLDKVLLVYAAACGLLLLSLCGCLLGALFALSRMMGSSP